MRPPVPPRCPPGPTDIVYRLVNGGFRVVFRALGLRFDVRGTQHIPADGPTVLASNHLSFLDFTFVGLAADRSGRLVRFMAKQAVFDHPLSAPLMRAMRHIPVDRTSGAAAYRRATRALTAGEVVGVFPEATISRAWTLKTFKPGAAALAIREQVPLIPVVTWGGQRILTVDGHRSLRRGHTVTVLVGAPMHPGPDEAIADVTAELRRRMQELLDEAQTSYPDRPRDDTDRWWLPRHLGGTALTAEAADALDQAAVARADLGPSRARVRHGPVRPK